MVNVHVIGMSHIDLGFTMTEEEFEELLELFAERMLGILDRCPAINYSIEQMFHYKKLNERRPDLLRRIKEYIHAGRIEIMGAMATSMETNFPCGESFIRNQKLGLEWAKENLEAEPESAWLVDTFGLHAQIPQIYSQFGFTQLFANRFGGDKHYEAFRAEGIDGTKMLVIGRDLASLNVASDSQAFRLCRSWADQEKLFEQADQLTGTGPRLVTDYIENEEVLSLHFVDLMKERSDRKEENWMLSSYHQYVKELKETNTEFPIISADLNPEFTGTFALRTPLKLRHRKTETQLLEAEKWISLLAPDYSPEHFEEAWWQMSFIQFHDVFSGSHGDPTFHAVCRKFDRIEETARKVLQEAAGLMTRQSENAFLYINGLAWKRKEWLPVPCAFQNRRLMQEGKELQTVQRQEGEYCLATLPPTGAVTITAGEKAAPLDSAEQQRCRIENEFLRLCVNPADGAISLYLADGTPLIENAADFLTVQEDVGGFQIENPHGGELFAAAGTVTVTPVRKDAMGESITVTGRFPQMGWNKGQNSLKWSATYAVDEGVNAVKIHLSLDWYGEGTRIRLHVPTTVRSSAAVYEIPFGVVERTAYRPRGTAKGEWPAQRFATLEDSEKGIALINTGAAGVQVLGRTLSSTLIRAYYPGPMAWVPPTAETSQHGLHNYDFTLVPYKGSWKDAGVVRQAQELNNPPLCFENRETEKETVSFVQVDSENIVVSAIKNATDHSGDLILRYYETFGKETKAVITVRDAISAVLSNVKEEYREALPCDQGSIFITCRPFEIQTLRVCRDVG